MLNIIKNINYSTCNLCFENKIIKHRCYICKYCMCTTCFNRYLQNDNTTCPHCREQLNIVVINNNQNTRFKLFNFFKNIKFKDDNNYLLIISLIIVIPILSYFVGYWVTKKYLFIILNTFLGFIIIIIFLLLLIIFYKWFCEW